MGLTYLGSIRNRKIKEMPKEFTFKLENLREFKILENETAMR